MNNEYFHEGIFIISLDRVLLLNLISSDRCRAQTGLLLVKIRHSLSGCMIKTAALQRSCCELMLFAHD